MEFQKSGMPHLHILICPTGLKGIYSSPDALHEDLTWKWILSMGYHLNPSNVQKNLMYDKHMQKENFIPAFNLSDGRFASYLALHNCKTYQNIFPIGWKGRVYGFINKSVIPRLPIIDINISMEQADLIHNWINEYQRKIILTYIGKSDIPEFIKLNKCKLNDDLIKYIKSIGVNIGLLSELQTKWL